jgi:hypothetical protein
MSYHPEWRPAFVFTLALLIPLGTALNAAEFQPHIVISVAGYDELKADLRYVGTLVGNPQLADALEGLILLNTRGQGLMAIDRTQRWGVALQLDAEAVLAGKEMNEAASAVVVVPVPNLKRLLTALEGLLGVAEEIEPGTFRVQSPEGEPLYLKQQGRWAVVANQQETLGAVPADPSILLRGIGDQYDLAMQINFSRLSPPLQDHLFRQFKQAVEESLVQAPEESDEQFAVRERMTEQLLGILGNYYGDVDQIVWGLLVDSKKRVGAIDFAIIAVPESVLARALSGLSVPMSRFANLDGLKGAGITATFNASLGRDLALEIERGLDSVRQELLSKAEEEENPELARMARTLTNKLVDFLKDVIAQPRVSTGAAIWLDPGKFAVVVAAQTPGSERVDALLQSIHDAVKKQPGAEAVVEPEVAQQGEVKFHRVRVKLSPEADETQQRLQELVGQDELELAAGVGPDIVLLAAGRDPIARMKEVLKVGNPGQRTEGNILSATMDLGAIFDFQARFAEKEEERDEGARMAEAARKVGQPAMMKVAMSTIPRGVRWRLEINEGVLKIVRELQAMQTRPGVVPLPFGPSPFPEPVPVPPAPRF